MSPIPARRWAAAGPGLAVAGAHVRLAVVVLVCHEDRLVRAVAVQRRHLGPVAAVHGEHDGGGVAVAGAAGRSRRGTSPATWRGLKSWPARVASPVPSTSSRTVAPRLTVTRSHSSRSGACSVGGSRRGRLVATVVAGAVGGVAVTAAPFPLASSTSALVATPAGAAGGRARVSVAGQRGERARPECRAGRRRRSSRRAPRPARCRRSCRAGWRRSCASTLRAASGDRGMPGVSPPAASSGWPGSARWRTRAPRRTASAATRSKPLPWLRAVGRRRASRRAAGRRP